MPGAVLLVRTPHTQFLGSVGLADVARRIPMRPDHAVRIGSITKTFVGVVAAQMQAEGLLDTEKFVTSYLPASITSRIQNSDRITVHQMLRHQSGIYNYDSSLLYALDRWLIFRHTEWPPLRMLEYSLDQPAVFPPGEEFSYSNPNYILTALIIDRITGHHHSEEIRRRILDPLQMTNSYYEGLEAPRGELAHGYQWLFGTYDTTDWTPVIGGEAGLVSTVSDLGVFIRAVAGTSGFLDPETRRVLKAGSDENVDSEPAARPVLRYDFGLAPTRASPGLPWFYGHRGIQPGYLCLAWHDPENDITVVFFGSSSQLRLFDNMKTAFEFYARIEAAVFEQATRETRGETIDYVRRYAPRVGSDLQGEWTGTVSSPLWPFSPLHLEVRIAEGTAGDFRAEMDNQAEAMNCQPLSVSYSRPGVELTLRSGAGRFRGEINRDRTKITGQWIRDGHATRATFARVQQPAAGEERLARKR